MAAGARLEEIHQGGIHEGVGVGDIEADNPGVGQVAAESGGKFGAMRFLHHENDVGPFDEIGRAGRFRVGGQAGGGDLEIGAGGEDLLGGWAAQAVAAAQKKNALQWLPHPRGFTGKPRNGQKFFGSFLQKRTAWLLRDAVMSQIIG